MDIKLIYNLELEYTALLKKREKKYAQFRAQTATVNDVMNTYAATKSQRMTLQQLQIQISKSI